jgi:hypothetical protein
MQKSAPKRASKRGITSQKLAIARAAALTNKCHETLAAIYGLTPRQIRRSIDKIKELAGVECITELAHWLHAHGMGFTCNEERESYLDNERQLKRAA